MRQVIQCLKQLSERHRMAIVTSIHQPNSLLLSMFDQLYVLSKGGHCVFAGRPNHLKDHLNNCGITCAPDILPIELLLKISSKFPNSVFKKRELTLNNNNNTKESINTTLVLESNEIDKLIESSWKPSQQFKENCLMSGKLSKTIDKQTNYFHLHHFYYLLCRGITCFVRYQWRVSASLAIFSFSVSAFLLYLYDTDIGHESGCLNLFASNETPSMTTSQEQMLHILSQESKVVLNLKCQFFGIAFLQFVSMACTILVFPQEVRIFLNEHHNKWYSTSSYFWAKSMVEIPVSVLIAYVYSFIIYYGTGQPDQTFRYIYFTLITTCGMIISNSTGYLLGIIFARNYQVATTSGVALFLVLVLLSGFFVPLTIQHVIVRGASYVSFTKIIFESILITLYGFDRCSESQMPILLHQLKLSDTQMKENMYWIIGHLIFWRLLALVVLIMRANEFKLSFLRRKQRLDSIETMHDKKSITLSQFR
ncbi:unnamed protein product [Medioppia subpectinata]|uniref:ABC-2 type transporter transmembrane domain-containing protein n=1 Tax=Medioppia subpectinata TaxID=1979941 RepID=A0A7R9KTR6_9ACAR|nr:unnamed protein product [Medioppia subpectinata]CAG2109311.1 unnamed protein product [Medioppia subpectinata]